MARGVDSNGYPARLVCAKGYPLCDQRKRNTPGVAAVFGCLRTIITATAMILLAHSGARAQDPNLFTTQVTVDRNKPMLLQADELIYDNKHNRVTARGNVEIYYNNYTLLADAVAYDQTANTLEAEGNVRMKEPDGAIINADRLRLTDDFREGFIGSLRVVTKDDDRIAAALATRKNGNITVFKSAVYTPCKPCRKHPERAPLWQIKAAKVIRDETAGNIYYEDAQLEFFGVPVAYFPYFFHADPTVKRRSGFLIPSIGQSEDFGTWTEIPYFWDIAPNMDITFTPRYMSKLGVLWQGEWRHRLANGTYKVELAGIFQNDSNETTQFLAGPLENDWRGSIKTEGRFNLGSWWQAGWDITAESDDTFRRFYKLDSIYRTDQVSKLYLEGINRRNYFATNLFHFGGLLADDTSNSESRVLPIADYDYVVDQQILGGELSFSANLTSLTRDNGADSSKIIANVRWRRQMIDDLGQVVTPFAELRGDAFKVSNHVDPVTGLTSTEDYVTRGMATAGIEYSYPFVAHTERASHVVEPIAQIIARPDGITQTDVPNEDAQSLVFDDSLLFDTDKFSGYDRIETGVRANFGIRYTAQLDDDGGYLRAVFGKSQHLSGDNPFAIGTGLGEDDSDYVAGVYFEPTKTLRLIAQSRFDADTFELQRQDVGASVTYGLVSGSVNYAFSRATPIIGLTADEQDLTASGQLRLTENWYALSTLNYDIEGSQLLSDSFGIKYADECFVLAVTYSESYFRDRDIDPNRSVMVHFELKHLGGTSIGSDSVSELVATSDQSKL